MAEKSLSRYLGIWEMLATNVKLRLSELPHLAPIVKELDAIVEDRKLESLIQENAKEGLVPAPDRPPGRDATAEDAERRIRHQRRRQRRDVALGAKSMNLQTTLKSGRAQD